MVFRRNTVEIEKESLQLLLAFIKKLDWPVSLHAKHAFLTVTGVITNDQIKLVSCESASHSCDAAGRRIRAKEGRRGLWK